MHRLSILLCLLLVLTACAPQVPMQTAMPTPSVAPTQTSSSAETPVPTAEDALQELLQDYAPQSLNMFRPFEPIEITPEQFAEEMAEQKLAFSETGELELKEMIEVCAESYEYAIQAFMENDKEKALKVIEKEKKADELEVTLRTKHIKRLTNQECNTEAGIVFLDTVICLERISDHARNIAEEVLEHTAL